MACVTEVQAELILFARDIAHSGDLFFVPALHSPLPSCSWWPRMEHHYLHTKAEKTILSITLSTMQLCCLILHCCKCLFWNGHLQSLAIKCLKFRSVSVQAIKINITHVVHIPQAAQHDQSSRGCRRFLEDETLPFCRTKDKINKMFKKGNFS